MNRHFGLNFLKGMQGSMDRQIGPNFEIGIHELPFRSKLKKQNAGIHGPPNWSELLWNCVGGLKTRWSLLGSRLRYQETAQTMTNVILSKHFRPKFLRKKYQRFLQNWNYYVIFSYYVMDNREPHFWILWLHLSKELWLFDKFRYG